MRRISAADPDIAVTAIPLSKPVREASEAKVSRSAVRRRSSVKDRHKPIVSKQRGEFLLRYYMSW
jgi:hypothetical protein